MYNQLFFNINFFEHLFFESKIKKSKFSKFCLNFNYLNFLKKEFFLEIDSLIYKQKTEEEKNLLRKNLKFKIKLFIPAQEAKMGAPLSPILSQYGINVKEFVDFFNENTKDIEPSYSVSCKIYLYKDKTYDVIFDEFSLIQNIIDYFDSKKIKYYCNITLLDFYKLYLLNVYEDDNFNILKFCKNAFSTFNSWNFFFHIRIGEVLKKKKKSISQIYF